MEHLLVRWRHLATRRDAAAPKRDDPHSPAHLDPADYDYVMFIDQKAAEESKAASALLAQPYGGGNQSAIDWAYAVLSPVDEANMKTLEARLPRNSFRGNFANRGGCDHCGASGLRYINIYLHKPSGDWIVVGSQCADRLALENRNAFEMDRARRADETRKKAAELRIKKEKWLNNADPEVRATLEGLMEKVQNGDQIPGILHSFVMNFKNWGNLSEKQIEVMLRVIKEEEVKAIERANPPMTVRSPVVEGTQEIEGVVISTKWQESDYGSTLKALVEDHRGFRVWGTVPSKANWEKGDRVRFTCSVERSHDDPYFGFYKRPRTIFEPDENDEWQRVAMFWAMEE